MSGSGQIYDLGCFISRERAPSPQPVAEENKKSIYQPGIEFQFFIETEFLNVIDIYFRLQRADPLG
jgi:hypothetical protein